MRRTIFFLRLNLAATAFFLCPAVRAQWQEDFNEGLDAWHGDKNYFVCRDGILGSNGPEAASRLSLCRELGAYSEGVRKGDSALCVEFGLQLGFIPSTTNFLRLYLLCGDTLLQDTSRALYLHLGMKSGKNYWQLWHSCKDSATLLYQGSTLFSKQSQMRMRVRAVFRQSRFSLYYTFDEGEYGREAWYLDGDSVEIPQLYNLISAMREPAVGPVCSYRTASRASLYVFTHINAGPVPAQYIAADNNGSDGDGTGLDKFLDSLALTVPPYGGAVLNEIMFEPATGESRFAEIRNPGTQPYNMRYWALAYLTEGTPEEGVWKYYRLSDNKDIILEPDDYWVAAKEAGKVALRSEACRENIHSIKSFPTLDAQSGYLKLVWLPPADSAERGGFDTVIIDEAYYTEEAHHRLLSDTKGVSLERLRAAASGLETDNWMSAAETFGFATPGCENSHTWAAGAGSTEDKGSDYFTLTPPLVTPNNDGLNDFTRISWDGRLDGFACSITVYDGAGRKLAQLCHKLLLGNGGELRYDAVDSEGRILRPGIYLLLIELIKADGKIKRLRLPLGVG